MRAGAMIVNTLPNFVKSYLRVPFVGIVWIMETFVKNRARLKTLMAEPRVASIFKGAVVTTVLVWLVIAVMANDEQRQRLSTAMQDLWTQTLGDAQ